MWFYIIIRYKNVNTLIKTKIKKNKTYKKMRRVKYLLI